MPGTLRWRTDREATPAGSAASPEAERRQEEGRFEGAHEARHPAAPAAEPSTRARHAAGSLRSPRHSEIPDRRQATGEAYRPMARSRRSGRAAEVAELFAAYRRTQDPELRNRLILMHLSLVRSLAAKFTHRGEPFDDLVQVGSMALIGAVDRFDPERGVQFSTFATPTIIGELKRHFRDTTWRMKPPRALQELSLHLIQANEALTQQLGRSPTVGEIAAQVGVTEEQTLAAMELSQNYDVISLDSPCRFDDDSETSSTLQDELAAADPALEKVTTYAALEAAVGRLANRERLILYLRFFQEFSQMEVAQRLNLSQMHVSRLERRALRRLKEMLTEAAQEERANLG